MRLKLNIFDLASQFFQQAVDEAPLLHADVHKQGLGSQPLGGVEASAAQSSNAKVVKKKKSSDVKYDVMAWVILAIGVVAWVGFAKANVHVSPSR